MLCVAQTMSICLLHAGILSKRRTISADVSLPLGSHVNVRSFVRLLTTCQRYSLIRMNWFQSKLAQFFSRRKGINYQPVGREVKAQGYRRLMLFERLAETSFTRSLESSRFRHEIRNGNVVLKGKSSALGASWLFWLLRLINTLSY